MILFDQPAEFVPFNDQQRISGIPHHDTRDQYPFHPLFSIRRRGFPATHNTDSQRWPVSLFPFVRRLDFALAPGDLQLDSPFWLAVSSAQGHFFGPRRRQAACPLHQMQPLSAQAVNDAILTGACDDFPPKFLRLTKVSINVAGAVADTHPTHTAVTFRRTPNLHQRLSPMVRFIGAQAPRALAFNAAARRGWPRPNMLRRQPQEVIRQTDGQTTVHQEALPMRLVEASQAAGLRMVCVIHFTPILNKKHNPWLSASAKPRRIPMPLRQTGVRDIGFIKQPIGSFRLFPTAGLGQQTRSRLRRKLRPKFDRTQRPTAISQARLPPMFLCPLGDFTICSLIHSPFLRQVKMWVKTRLYSAARSAGSANTKQLSLQTTNTTVLRSYSIISLNTSFLLPFLRWQQGQRWRRRTIPTISSLCSVAIEVGLCRSGRTGGSSGSSTSGNARFLESRLASNSFGGEKATFGDQ